MSKTITLHSGAWQKDLEMTIVVNDEEMFKKECIDINRFFGNSDYRKLTHGSHEKAGLALFAAECFQRIAFNNFKDESWLTLEFDWSKDKGVEGFPSMDDLGIEIKSIDSWFFDSEEIKISGWV